MAQVESRSLNWYLTWYGRMLLLGVFSLYINTSVDLCYVGVPTFQSRKSSFFHHVTGGIELGLQWGPQGSQGGTAGCQGVSVQCKHGQLLKAEWIETHLSTMHAVRQRPEPSQTWILGLGKGSDFFGSKVVMTTRSRTGAIIIWKAFHGRINCIADAPWIICLH